jgi:hypothetical protein
MTLSGLLLYWSNDAQHAGTAAPSASARLRSGMCAAHCGFVFSSGPSQIRSRDKTPKSLPRSRASLSLVPREIQIRWVCAISGEPCEESPQVKTEWRSRRELNSRPLRCEGGALAAAVKPHLSETWLFGSSPRESGLWFPLRPQSFDCEQGAALGIRIQVPNLHAD